MRITGGRACGIRLEVPNLDEVRPATDFLRIQLFNQLANKVLDAKVLDCFSGTGAYGLEALSRGCQSVVFVEKNLRVARHLKRNIERVCKSAEVDLNLTTRVFVKDMFIFSLQETFNLIFFDPPYPLWKTQFESLCDMVKKFSILHSNAQLVLELPSGLTLHLEDLGWIATEGKQKKIKHRGAPFFVICQAIQSLV